MIQAFTALFGCGDEVAVFEDVQVLFDCGAGHGEMMRDLADCQIALVQKGEDFAASWVGEGAEQRLHL